MQWTSEAESLIKKVPFFVRKRVRQRVEQEARADGRTVVDVADVRATQQRFLNNMSREVKGYQIDTCFGESGCPNRAASGEALLPALEEMLQRADLLSFLRAQVDGELKFHHEFRITVADCPNACSQPQIKDIGIIGAVSPQLTDMECSRCMACVDACKELAVRLGENAREPAIDPERCLYCGQCAAVCPTGTISAGARGYRIMVGGKLGRHPQLAIELPGIHSVADTLAIVSRCLSLYKEKSRGGRRLGEIISPEDLHRLVTGR